MADKPNRINLKELRGRLTADEEEALSSIIGLDIAEKKSLDALFGGTIRTVKGKRVREFLVPGSEDEKAAFRILARLLRDDRLPKLYRLCLANLFNPDIGPGPAMESRKLVFVRRRQRGRKGYDEISGSIAIDIQRAILEGRKLESAVPTAAEQYGVSARTITRTWSEYKKHPGIAAFLRQALSRKVSK
jgi:hypothetical protein